MTSNSLLKGLKPMHPGEMLREDVLPALGKTKTEIAGLLGVSRQTLFDILSEKQPVTPAMALRFGKLLGNGPDLWIDLQRAYDLHVAEKQLGKALAKIPTISAAGPLCYPGRGTRSRGKVTSAADEGSAVV